MPEAPNPKLRPHVPPPTMSTAAVPSSGPYAELAVTTNLSFLRGASHPDELVYRAAELGYRAVGVTDFNSLAGIVRAHEAAKKASLPLVVGTRVRLVDGPDVLVWVPDRQAYGRLCRLLTVGRRRTDKGDCVLSVSDLLDHGGGLWAALCLPDPAKADASFVLGRLKESFGPRLSIAICREYDGVDARRIGRLADLSRAIGIPLLATNDVRYHDQSRRPLMDVLTCVRHRCTLADAGYRLTPNAERYLKSPDQMNRLFADYPRAIRRGLEVAEACRFSLDELKYEYPDEVVPPGRTRAEYLAELTWAGASARYPGGVPDKVRRLVEKELALIGELAFEAYFLTVHDLVRFAREKDILCQGRGSAANSAVCYCLGVTCVDPDRIDTLFARFISGARNEPPDIDIDFEHERREEVIQYVYDKYGRDRAGMTATVISYRGRSAVRDVGKALGLGADVIDQIAGRLEWWDSGRLADDDVRTAGLDPAERTVRQLIGLTTELLGFPRHLSQHTGGMVMSRGPLCELVPIENAAMPGRTVIEWDKDDIDALGLMKVDILALGMLTCIRKCLDLVNDRRPPDAPAHQLYTIPPEDPVVYDMICDADTVGVFQIESRAQMSMLPRLRPRAYYDLVIEVAIVRPGPIQGDMVHPYLKRRLGQEPVDYVKPQLEAVLKRTLGVPLFQEQAMQIAIVAAGFTEDEADELRRKMAAWKRGDGLGGFHDKFVDGMTGNGYPAEFAERCFKQICGFGSYGFPESHAASFAALVYASCWLKRHHPAPFLVAILNSQPMGFYAPAQLVSDARRHGVTVRPVDVNHSHWDTVLENQTRARRPTADPATWGHGGPAVRLGFGRVRRMRQADADRIVDGRRQGPYTSVADLHDRTRLTSAAVRRLADADAFASMSVDRRPALWDSLALSEQPVMARVPGSPVDLPPMPAVEEVIHDYAMTGLSLKNHPVAFARDRLRQQRILTAAQLLDGRQCPSGRWAKVAGLVLLRQRPGTASGIVFMTLEDETGTINLILWSDIYERNRSVVRTSQLLQAEGYVQRDDHGTPTPVVHLLAKRFTDRTDWLGRVNQSARDFR